MTFRVRIITPIQVDASDLARRQLRYGERASVDTTLEVVALESGPTALESTDDIEASEDAVFAACSDLSHDHCDALLVDCIFDPAVKALQAHLSIPVFGPLQTTTANIPLVVQSVGMVARVRAHIPVFEQLFADYGAADRLAAVRALDLPYADARDPVRFDAAMSSALRAIVNEDEATGVIMGSTTMAINPEVATNAGGAPLFLSGMLTLGIMESLWCDGVLK
ncbi:MAG: aspartate/glutamate racemase family protein [Gammaproteobacteria bacterium]|nr:aspartate/glutamate racemase family protein [Gammaproteobacteria bacterium]